MTLKTYRHTSWEGVIVVSTIERVDSTLGVLPGPSDGIRTHVLTELTVDTVTGKVDRWSAWSSSGDVSMLGKDMIDQEWVVSKVKSELKERERKLGVLAGTVSKILRDAENKAPPSAVEVNEGSRELR